MDPNATLERIRKLYTELLNSNDQIVDPKVQELLESVENLDDWLSAGGLKPTDWK